MPTDLLHFMENNWPPVLPDVKKTLENFIINNDELPYESTKTLPRERNESNVIHAREYLPCRTTLFVEDIQEEEDVESGHGYHEIILTDETWEQAFFDPVDPDTDSDSIVKPSLKKQALLSNVFKATSNSVGSSLINCELKTVPPGLDHGMDFGSAFKDYMTQKSAKSEVSINLSFQQMSLDAESEILESTTESDKKDDEGEDNYGSSLEKEIIQNLPSKINHNMCVLDISKVTYSQASIKKTEWAEILDSGRDVDLEFKKLNLATSFNFELDGFQKQGIVKLEEHANVLIAAHTSAGKTVIAEYAIAMALKHKTKVIYTSPIKALSNQKFRDFKDKFDDVGLITGDFQMNQLSSVLIMTTEILRSMLFNSSKVIQELEFVIFDEVHYLNDTERGRVWEEVLILLPSSVQIIMLSATISNTFDIANWVGRTKQKKVFVISTPKRPVPLCHFVYLGVNEQTENEIYLIREGDGVFQKDGYRKALEVWKRIGGPYCLTNPKKKPNQSYEKREKGVSPRDKNEKRMWKTLLGFLKKEKKLPVVIFTLSRVRCDKNANSLLSEELTTGEEKKHIQGFFHFSISQLKEEDRKLPQVLKLQELLMSGIGVHHSGIIPILKEVVEILFQKGFVKCLFATETFAIGINMPAKSVVFDSLIKFDGKEKRLLTSAEYIQMAGRAGRRGIDEKGTVIIMAKDDMQPAIKVERMITGQALQIKSQYVLTYSTILNSLRVTNLFSVENMMQHSFMEFGSQSVNDKHRKELQKLENIQVSIPDRVKNLLFEFYDTALEFLEIWNKIKTDSIMDKEINKILVEGRILLITYREHINKLAVILSVDHRRMEYKVLVLSDSTKDADSNSVERPDLWYNMMSLLRRREIYKPQITDKDIVITINLTNILGSTSRVLKANFELVSQDWGTRQIPRFRDKQPGENCMLAIRTLSEMSRTVNAKEILWTSETCPFRTLSFVSCKEMLSKLETKLSTFSEVSKYLNYFEDVFENKKIHMRRKELKCLLSPENMDLHQDYKEKIAVLESLEFIDKQRKVLFKGHIACQMGTQELIIVQLLMNNVFMELSSAEVAALLSALVYKGKEEPRPDLCTISTPMQKAIEMFDNIYASIAELERRYMTRGESWEYANSEPNFYLLPVIYEWAKESSFVEIMKLTKIQEGIIIRTIQQLHEMISDVRDATKLIGLMDLGEKMDDAARRIRRNIVFSASLYTNPLSS
nr:PREDICTED: helicase SKI2W [Bemisia tabaci]